MVSTFFTSGTCFSLPVQSGQRPPYKRPNHLQVRGGLAVNIRVSCIAYTLMAFSLLHHTPCVLMVWISSSGPKTHPPIPAEAERELLGNGEWPYPLSSGSTSQNVSIPPPPQEGVDHAPKMAYKMTSRPRGIGKLLIVVISLFNAHHILLICQYVKGRG